MSTTGQILRKFGLHYIGSKLGIMKKILTTRESTYIELIFSKKIRELIFIKKPVPLAKGFCHNKQLKKCPKSSKNDQNQDLESRFQGT